MNKKAIKTLLGRSLEWTFALLIVAFLVHMWFTPGSFPRDIEKARALFAEERQKELDRLVAALRESVVLDGKQEFPTGPFDPCPYLRPSQCEWFHDYGLFVQDGLLVIHYTGPNTLGIQDSGLLARSIPLKKDE